MPRAQAISSISSISSEKATEVCKRVIAEATGYDVVMLESSLELESELGIDSIARVSILSSVQNELNIEAKDVEALSRTQTVGEVIACMIKELGASSVVELPQRIAPVQSAAVGSTSGISSEKATEVCKRVVAEATGYDVDMLESSLELESELGIDSIARFPF